MRKSVRRLRLSRETLQRLAPNELGQAAGQLPTTTANSNGQEDCTAGSCGYFICAPSNPWPC